MRTHFLDTRSRIKSVVMDIKAIDGFGFHVPYLINGSLHYEVYDMTGVLVDENQTPTKVRYERRN